jgi:hypothetical protein
VGYGQHQSFYLRPHWLYKALKEIKNDERFFYDEFCFEKLGVGKNMAKSIRYWCTATNVMEEQRRKDGKTVHKLTQFGELIF